MGYTEPSDKDLVFGGRDRHRKPFTISVASSKKKKKRLGDIRTVTGDKADHRHHLDLSSMPLRCLGLSDMAAL